MKITKEIKIALVAIVSIVLLFFGMNFLKGMTLFSSGNSYYITFNDISGLSLSSPIFANGYRVGVVKDVSFDYENNGDVVVEFMVDDDLQIPRGSTAEIVSDLMGNVKMNLLLADNPRDFVAKGDTIMGVINSGMLGKAKDMIPVIEKMLPKLDSILANINMLLSDPNIGRTLGNVQKTTENLTVTTQQLNALMANVNKDVPGLMGKASGLLDNANNLTANLAAVDVASTVAKVDQTLANVQQLTSKLNNNKGTLGLLMNDETLFNNLTNTVLSADSLLNNLREHPKRYVHLKKKKKKDK